MHNCEGEWCLICFRIPRSWKLIRDYSSMQSLGLLGLVFDTGLSVTQLMGHLGLGCLATRWSVPVEWTKGIRFIAPWACMYSLPLLPSIYMHHCLGTNSTRFAILPKHGCHSKQLLIWAKVLIIFWYIVTTPLWGGPPCTYCPNLSSKFLHLNPKQPCNILPFLHYELVTEHSIRIQG